LTRVDIRALALIASLAIVASVASLANGFAYDDQWIIVTNNRVHSLDRWADWIGKSYWPTLQGSLYRPLTSAAFALQWVIGQGTPLIFHIVNVALYAAGAVAFTWFASLLLPAAAAVIVGALFAVHPVHVEAVANVVGQSELSAGLLLIVALALYIRARRAGALTVRARLGLAALYLAAVFTKEHALVLPAWFIAAECTVLRDGARVSDHVRKVWREVAPLFIVLAAVAAFALAARWRVLDTLGGDIPHPALNNLGVGERGLVMLGVLPDLVRLLVWPARLYADYSPAHLAVSSTPNPSQLNGVVVAIGGLLLFAFAWKRSAAAALGFLLAAIALAPTANILLPSGILLAERTLYLPSAALLLALGTAVAWADRKFPAPTNLRDIGTFALGVVLVLGVARSVERQRVWRSTPDVFYTMVTDEPASFKAHQVWGGLLFERGDLVGGEREWRMAIRIFPGYHKLYQDLAHRYRENGLCVPAIPLYEKALELDRGLPLSRAGLVACQLALGRFREARNTARLGILDGNDPAWFRARLRSADSALAVNDSTR
jgi:hypothetical protein